MDLVYDIIVNYGKELKIGADIRKKKIDRKDNRVCKKDEESIRRDRSSVKNGIERNEEVGR